MKPNRFFLLLVVLLFFSTLVHAQMQRDWENPEIFERNQTRPHTPLASFNTIQEALQSHFKQSPYLQKLNGAWKFHWSAIPEEAPAQFYLADFDVSRWDDIAVPSCWQMQGFGHPLFRNVHQPFPANPPFPPADYNPVGSYRRTFTLPESWAGRRILLHFEGVKSASYVWINGQEVGYHQGGMEMAEYDITDHVKSGENIVAVRVFRYSDGTYLECQDMWRLSGIYRDVYLLAVPQVHIRDYYIVTDLDRNYRNATFKIEADIQDHSAAAQGHQLRVQLYDPTGKAVFPKPLLQFISSPGPIHLQQKVKNPLKWSAEYPHLYRVTLELLDPEGGIVEALAAKVGFRKVEVKNQAIYINGMAIKFNGVNSHVHHPETGRAMDVETMRKDLVLMKQFNINCVRTSHYPPNIEYLELADELGMYIVDEVNDESHATEYVSKRPEWRAQYVNRAEKMVYRDRNHPSVVIWSAGNESGSGDNIAALIEAGKKIDPSRPAWLYGGNEDLLPFEDIVGPRYPTPEFLERNVAQVPRSQDPRPSFMDEYLAATGNSLGHLEEYWEVIFKYRRTTGGAIWDWVSPGITQPIQVTPGVGFDGYVMGRAHLVPGLFGHALDLSGHDEWVALYRDPRLDLAGIQELTLSLWLYPRRWNGTGSFITKGNRQFGLTQVNRDTVEFYVHSGSRHAVLAPLPRDWSYKWHHLAGIYDGSALRIYIDGRPVAAEPFAGPIDLSPFPLAIGKNTELHGQEHPGELCNAIIDRVAVAAKALDIQELYQGKIENPLLMLDFEEIDNRGEFFSLGIGGRTYGLIWPDRRVQPELYQLKKTPQPVKIEWLNSEKRLVKITNRHFFKNLKELDCRWTLCEDDQVLQSGQMTLDIAPQKSRQIRVPYAEPDLQSGAEYRLLIRFALPQATDWAEVGHEVAWEQLPLSWFEQSVKSLPQHGQAPVTVQQDDASIRLTGEGWEYLFDKKLGRIVEGHVNGKKLFAPGPQLNAWRAPISNELERQWGRRIIVDEYRAAGLDRLEHRVDRIEVEQRDEGVSLFVITQASAPGFTATFINEYRYLFHPDGEILLQHEVHCSDDFPEWIPRLGLALTLPGEFDQMSWYGRGPFETYPDRKTGAKIGIYHGSVAEQFVPYLIPQENGNKSDVRWAAFTNREGLGLFVSGDSLLNVSAHLYPLDNLDRAWYPFQLEKDRNVHVYIDHRVTGVGGTPVKTLE